MEKSGKIIQKMDEKNMWESFHPQKFIDYLDGLMNRLMKCYIFFVTETDDERKILQNYAVEIAIFYVFIHRFRVFVFLNFHWLVSMWISFGYAVRS